MKKVILFLTFLFIYTNVFAAESYVLAFTCKGYDDKNLFTVLYQADSKKFRYEDTIEKSQKVSSLFTIIWPNGPVMTGNSTLKMIPTEENGILFEVLEASIKDVANFKASLNSQDSSFLAYKKGKGFLHLSDIRGDKDIELACEFKP